MMIKTPLQEQQKKQARPNKRPEAKQNGRRKANGFHSTGNNGHVVYGTKQKKKKEKTLSLPSVPAWKMIVGAVVIGVLGVLYLNHVFATQELLTEVQQLENEYQKAKRRNAEYRLTYDRMIGPKEIYQQAKEQGFVNGGPADNVITVEEE